MILKKRHKDVLLALAQEYLASGVRLIVYGSRANDTAHDASDLDLALQHISGQPVDIDELIVFEEAVQDSTIPFPVEIFDYVRLPESFLKAIDEQGVMLSETVRQE